MHSRCQCVTIKLHLFMYDVKLSRRLKLIKSSRAVSPRRFYYICLASGNLVCRSIYHQLCAIRYPCWKVFCTFQHFLLMVQISISQELYRLVTTKSNGKSSECQLLFTQEISWDSNTIRSRSSSVSIVSDYGLDDRDLIPGRAKDFSSSLCVQTGSETHPASCTMGTGGPFSGAKRGRGVTLTNHSHLVLRSRMSRSYTPPPQEPPWHVAGLLCFDSNTIWKNGFKHHSKIEGFGQKKGYTSKTWTHVSLLPFDSTNTN
jgi:hypothetical protein